MELRDVVVVLAALVAGCSLVDPIDADEYTAGGGGSGPGAATGGTPGGTAGGGASSTAAGVTTSASAGAGGEGGARPTDGTSCSADGPQPTSDFADDFDDGVIGTWFVYPPGSDCASESGGEVRLDAPAHPEYCKYVTECPTLVLRDSAVWIHVVAPASGSSVLTTFEIDVEDHPTLTISVSEAGLMKITFEESEPLRDGLPFAGRGWWKIGADGDDLVFSTSDDGESWTEELTFTPPYSLDEPVEIKLGVGLLNPGGRADTPARFDDLNVAPR